MKNGYVIVPFVDSKTGISYNSDDEFKGNKKRFDELVKMGLISENVSEDNSEETNTQNEDVTAEEEVTETEEEQEGNESVEPEEGKEVSEDNSEVE